MEDIIHWDQNPVSVTFRFTVLGVGDISINFDCSTETLKDTKPDLYRGYIMLYHISIYHLSHLLISFVAFGFPPLQPSPKKTPHASPLLTQIDSPCCPSDAGSWLCVSRLFRHLVTSGSFLMVQKSPHIGCSRKSHGYTPWGFDFLLWVQKSDSQDSPAIWELGS